MKTCRVAQNLTGLVCAHNCDVQCGQRVALMGPFDKQYGQSLSVGALGTSGFAVIWLTARINKKRANATITKLITVLMNAP